jgi:hypothetical protein
MQWYERRTAEPAPQYHLSLQAYDRLLQDNWKNFVNILEVQLLKPRSHDWCH